MNGLKRRSRATDYCTRCGHELCRVCRQHGTIWCDRLLWRGAEDDPDLCCDGECTVTGDDPETQTPILSTGTRVRLLAPSAVLDPRSDTGFVVRPDTREGYYIVRLDRPALYRRADGSVDEVQEIREAADNLAVLHQEQLPRKERSNPR